MKTPRFFPMKLRKGPSSRDEEGEPGLFMSCGGTLGVPVDGRRGCRGTSSVALRVSRTLSGLGTECAISLEMLQSERASARVEGRISWFFSRCRGFPLELRWEHQGPARGASGRSSVHSSREGPLGITRKSLPGLRSSSGVEAGSSGYLCWADMDQGFPLGWPQGSQASSHVESCKPRFSLA